MASFGARGNSCFVDCEVHGKLFVEGGETVTGDQSSHPHQSVDFRGLPNVLTIGIWFLYGCYSLTTIGLSPLSNIMAIGHFG